MLQKSRGAYPVTFNIQQNVPFYFQTCSILINCVALASMAATLAAGGTSPLTSQYVSILAPAFNLVQCPFFRRVLKRESVKACLQLMLSCGMYDFSGEWACTIGLPAKSGVCGAIFAVVPNVCVSLKRDLLRAQRFLGDGDSDMESSS